MADGEQPQHDNHFTTVDRSATTRGTAASRPDPRLFIAHSPLENFVSWFTNKPSEPTVQPTEASQGLDIHHLVSTTIAQISSSPAAVASISAVSATGLTLLSVVVYRKYVRRIRNADYVTSGMIQERKWIKGVVTRWVGEQFGSRSSRRPMYKVLIVSRCLPFEHNFRLFHTPAFYSWPFKFRKVPTEVKGVDAPEAAHFGRPSQPHSKESLDWLRETLLQPKKKIMKCQILRKDQYGRIVAVPYIHRHILPNRPLPIEMLRTGMAVVYESGGAEYGPWGLEKMKQVEAEAKSARRGIWGINNFESPGEYKKRYRVGDDATDSKEDVKMTPVEMPGIVTGLHSLQAVQRAS
ncbi:hypothetical protein QFC22_001860 [Naganishia vaughanmartiniae]|uniref:Uncharacterized protein n=1 Tax=Naganishia vaughanmartiniae TaxID=1424756 RepID=A0ACC2XFQ3_9TREE|nr:hypothetical protein QFC22_001860 [Naganishia vaughanmartiniae]